LWLGGTSQVPGKVAHTSLVYIVVPMQELFSPPAAAYFLTYIDGAQTGGRISPPDRMPSDSRRFYGSLEMRGPNCIAGCINKEWNIN